MKKLKPTTQYKKDYKRYRNNPKKLTKLFHILGLLQNEQPILWNTTRIHLKADMPGIWNATLKTTFC